jgi:hypothetical protein
VARARACDDLAEDGGHFVGFLRCEIAGMDSEWIDVLLNHSDRYRAIREFVQRSGWPLYNFFIRGLYPGSRKLARLDVDPLTSSLLEDSGDKAERGCAPLSDDLRVTGVRIAPSVGFPLCT